MALDVMPNRMVKAGEAVFKEGDASDGLYYICYGKVAISRETAEGKTELATLGEGDVFGEMSIINGAARNATVTATQDAGFLVLNQESFQKQVNDLSPTMRGIFRVLVVTIRSMLNERGELDSTLVRLSEELEKSKAMQAQEENAGSGSTVNVGRPLAF